LRTSKGIYLGGTLISILLSLYLYRSGRRQTAIFVGLWAPTVLNLGQTLLEDDSPLEGSAATPEDALVAAAELRRRGQEKRFDWDVPSSVSGCSLAGAGLILRRDGSASWRGVVHSIYSNDSYCVKLSFFNSGGRELFSWPRFCSQTLWQSPQVWRNDNLAFPERFFDSIAIVSRRDDC
jgi:hypothetical protein